MSTTGTRKTRRLLTNTISRPATRYKGCYYCRFLCCCWSLPAASTACVGEAPPHATAAMSAPCFIQTDHRPARIYHSADYPFAALNLSSLALHSSFAQQLLRSHSNPPRLCPNSLLSSKGQPPSASSPYCLISEAQEVNRLLRACPHPARLRDLPF